MRPPSSHPAPAPPPALRRGPDGVARLLVGASGFRRIYRGLFALATAFLSLFLCVWVVLCLTVLRWQDPGAAVLFLFMGTLILLGFLGASVGIGMALAGQRVTFDLAPDRFRVHVKRPLWDDRRLEWPREGLRAVRVAPAGLQLNGNLSLALQIVPTTGEPVALLGGRPNRELIALCDALRAALDLKDAADAPVLPAPGPADTRAAATPSEQGPHVLDYSNTPAPDGAAVEALEDGVRITLAEPPASTHARLRVLVPAAFFFFGLFPLLVPPAGSVWFAALFAVVFLAAGLGLALHAAHRFRRRVSFEVRGGELGSSVQSPVWRRVRRWPLAEVYDVIVGVDPGNSGDARPEHQLAVLHPGGETTVLFAAEDEQQLRSIADLLRREILYRRDTAPAGPAAQGAGPRVPVARRYD